MTLTVGAAFDFPIQLALSAANETLTVNAEPAVIETARTQVAGTMSQNEMKDLPLNGRNYFESALFVPGVSPTNTAALSFSRKLRRCRAKEFRSAASAIFRTASSSTA